MRILLADDHDLVRDAISALLTKEDPDMDVTQACDFSEALAAVRAGPAFDVIILDLRMPGMNGLSGAQKMREVAPASGLLIMSGSANSNDVRAALKLGARGFVPKTLAGRSLSNAIRLVAAGDSYVPAELLTANDNTANGVAVRLTDREAEVLAQLRLGNSNKDIARALSIAETTVKLHIRSLSDKFAARNRTDIVVRAIETGLA